MVTAEGIALAGLPHRERRAIEQEAFYTALNRLDEADHDRISAILRTYTTEKSYRSPIPGVSNRGMLELLAKLGMFLARESSATDVGAGQPAE